MRKKPSDATGDSVGASESVVVPQSVIAWEMEVRALLLSQNLSDPVAFDVMLPEWSKCGFRGRYRLDSSEMIWWTGLQVS